MAYCRKCGNWLPDTAQQCNVCGEKCVPAQSQQPQYQAPRQPQYQQPQYQQPQYQQPQYQQPQQGYPTTYNLPKNGSQQPQYQQPQYRAPQQPPISSQPPKPKKNGGKIALFVILGIVLVGLIITGVLLLGGGSDKNEEYLGRYDVISCYENGMEVETDGDWISLKEKGKATMHIDYETYSAEWELDGEDLTIIQDGDEYFGTLADDILTLDLDGLLYTFGKDGAMPATEAPATEPPATEAPAAPAPEAPPATEAPATEAPSNLPAVDTEWWDGNWYGWWIIDTGWGHWEQYESHAWDVCARISVDPSTCLGTLEMWDDDTQAQTRWDVDIFFEESSDPRGILRSSSGVMMTAAMPYGEWRVNPAEWPYSDFEGFIHISGTWQDPSNSANRCEYSIFLRPWGMDWSDIRYGDMSNMPYTDMMPIHYDSWYVPYLNGGKPMPNSFH